MNIRVTKNRSAFCFLAALGLLLLGSCFQPVDIGETFVETGTAHLKLSNDSEDDSYILEGFELRNAEGETVQSWDHLDLAAGKSRDIHTETEGSYTLWYRVKDTWISSTAVDLWEGGPVDIALNRSHDFSFKRENFKVVSRDEDNDGLPDIWEAENGFNPEDPADGGPVYVRGNGQDELDSPDEADGQKIVLGTRDHPYKTLAKAVEKARRGLNGEACTVVVLGTLDWQNGNPPDPDDRIIKQSLFVLGKTRHPLTIRGEDLTNPEEPGVLQGNPGSLKRVLYIGPGANVTLLNITITGGKQTGGGIYASGAKLTLGKDTTITENESFDVVVSECGGVYIDRGELIMEANSSITGNTAGTIGGISLVASTLTMNGGAITKNYALRTNGGLLADGSTLEMFDGAEISENTVGKKDDTVGGNGGGVGLIFSTLTMHSGSKIYKNKVYSGFAGGIYATGESKLIMKAGSVISENECTVENSDSSAGGGGGIELVNKSSLIMEGGSITNNTAVKHGGGVYVTGESSFTMNGGSIKDNKSETTDGGGIFLGTGTFIMTGGGITTNTAKYGGGVYVIGESSFTMAGGDITGNTASVAGGGVILWLGASFNMTNGEIAKNTATVKGGGVYVYGYPSTDNPPKAAAVFTMIGGHIYGGSDDNKNTVENGGSGPVIYVATSTSTGTSEDQTITSFPGS
jgi:hypothetical protein